MAAGLERVIHLVHSIAKLPDGSQSSDLELLDRYLAGNDQLAFAELVHRHGCLVLNVCKRILTNHQDAEDAFQATFLILASKARKVREHSVGSWLHTVAYRTALSARSRRQQRTRFESIVDTLPERAVPPPDAERWRYELDLAVKQLPVKYREPIVLCELGNVSRKAAAKQLGVPEGTLSSRLNRARAILARRLRQRGIEPLALILGRAGVSSTGGIVSKTLVEQTCRLAVLMAVDGNFIATGPVGMLMQGVQKTMWIAKWKAAAGVMGVFALLAIGSLPYFPTALTAAQEKPATPQAVATKSIPVAAEEEAKLLQEIIRGHAANREAIRTFHLKALMVTDTRRRAPEDGKELEFECWQQGDKCRETKHWLERVGWEAGLYVEGQLGPVRSDNLEDTVIIPGNLQKQRIRNVKGQGETRTATVWAIPGKPGDLSELWQQLGLSVNGYGAPNVSEWLSNKSYSKSIKRILVNNEKSVELVCRQGNITIALTINPSKGYLVVGKKLWVGLDKESIHFSQLEVDEIRTPAPGIYFPHHALSTSYACDANQTRVLSGVTEIWVDFLEINQQIPPEHFASPISEGALVSDHTKDLQYFVGPDGNPAPSSFIRRLGTGAVIRQPK